MKNRLSLLLWFVAGLYLAESAVAETNELLVSIDRQTLQKIEKRNARFLAENRFFSIRDRIVRINPDLLFASSGQFTITPFPGIQYIVETKSVRRRPHLTVWSGIVVNPSLPVNIFETLSPDERQGLTVDELKDVFLGISLTVSEYDRDMETGEVYHSARRPKKTQAGGPSGEPPSSPAQLELGAIRTVKGTLNVEAVGGQYELRPLEFDPEYHIVYEVNQAKVYRDVGPDDHSAFADDQRRRYLAFKDFERTLDEKPRPQGDQRGAER